MSFPIYTHGRRDQAKVALTFDDGPNPPRTDQILEILASHNARATFFVIGKWAERWPDLPDRRLEIVLAPSGDGRRLVVTPHGTGWAAAIGALEVQ